MKKKHTLPQKEFKPKHDGKRKQKQKPNETFLSKLRAAALHQTKLHMEKQALQNRSFTRVDEEELTKSPKLELITLTSDSTQGSPLKIYTLDNKYDFMATSPDSPDIPTNFTSKISTPKLDKAEIKIQTLNATPKTIKSPIQPKAIPSGTTTIQSNSTKIIPVQIISSETVPVRNTKLKIQEQSTTETQQQNIAHEHERNKEQYTPITSPGKIRFQISNQATSMMQNLIIKFLFPAGGMWCAAPNGDWKLQPSTLQVLLINTHKLYGNISILKTVTLHQIQRR